MNFQERITQPVIFFDGYCNLCNRAVQWIIRHDKEGKYLLAPLNSAYAEKSIPSYVRDSVDSIVLLEGGEIYLKSTAALIIAKNLSYWGMLLYGLIIIPPLIRNLIYDLIARFRYRWFGKQDTCMVPSPDIANRFLD